MNILLVDDGSKSLKNLESALDRHAIHSIRFEEFDFGTPHFESFPNLIILSGGSQYSVTGNELRFAKEIEFIRTYTYPILGICFGCELMAHSFGATLEKLDQKESGPRTLTILKQPDPLFENNPQLQVFESHRWAITNLPDELVGIARSETGFEIIRHKTLPRIGFQFHPESSINTSGGMGLLERALREFA